MRLPARCQGLSIPLEGALAFELYQQGNKVFCIASPGPQAVLRLSAEKPDAPPISAFGSQLRKLFRGSALIRISRKGGALFFDFEGRDKLILIYAHHGGITVFRNGRYILGDRTQNIAEDGTEIDLSGLPIEMAVPDLEEADRAQKKSILEKLISREIKKSERKLQAIERDAARIHEAARLRLEAETLLNHRHALPERPSGPITLESASGEMIRLELSGERSFTEAIDGRFHRARRLERGHLIASERAEEERRHLQELERARESLEELSLEEIERELELRRDRSSAPGSRKAGPQRRMPFRSFRSKDDFTILVGRSARDNDELTMKIARPHELFFHLRGAPGSHIIVRSERKQRVPEETILDAAALAHHFSTFAKEASAEIQMTERRYLRKPRGSAEGAVRLLKEKTILIQREPERIRRLLSTERR